MLHVGIPTLCVLHVYLVCASALHTLLIYALPVISDAARLLCGSTWPVNSHNRYDHAFCPVCITGPNMFTPCYALSLPSHISWLMTQLSV